jgi:hypothetical protein
MITNSQSKFLCIICKKEYTNRQNLWRHTKTHHNTCKSNVSQNSLQNDQKQTFVSQNEVIVSQNLTTNDINGYSCEFCNKIYTHRQSKYKHQLKCKNKKNKDDQNKINSLLFEQLEEQKKQNEELKKTIMELLNKNCKIHPKTLQKINKQLNLNGDHNTINNGTINNNYNIIALGHENLTNVFSRKEKMSILKYRYCSLPQLVEYTHFNDKYPQFKNILITNTQNTLAYKFDNKKKKFITVNKNDLLDDIIDERMCDLSSFYDELENDLDEKTKEILEIVKEKIDNDPAYKELKKKDIKLIIYNNRDKVDKDSTNDLELEV